jgi:hypothetical protein
LCFVESIHLLGRKVCKMNGHYKPLGSASGNMASGAVAPAPHVIPTADIDVFCTRAEWKIHNMSAKLREFPKGTSLWSPEFSAGGLRKLQLEFFPNGRETATLNGYCSLFFWCPEGTHVRYQLFVGSHKRAPDEDNFDTRMGHGHSNLCHMLSEIDSQNDCVTVGVEILDVQKTIDFGSGLRVYRPPMHTLMARYVAVSENRHIGRVEWKIPGIERKIKTLPVGASLYSPVFSAAGIRDMLIEFYPNGNLNTTKQGHCSVYLRCPEGTQIFVTLIVGEVKRGPISARFDGHAGKGLPEFCQLASQIIDDTVTVALELKNPALSPYLPTTSADGKLAVLNL